MIAGRLHWRDARAKIPGRLGLAAFDFSPGTLILTEAGTRKGASLYLVRGQDALCKHDPGGVEVLDSNLATFLQARTRHHHTLKRALTDPRLLSGIGNAYSDEILHWVRLSPVRLTQNLVDAEVESLYEAVRKSLLEWTDRLRNQVAKGFPEKLTAFREGMAVHGRYGKPCPDCKAPVQRIVYAANETNYCSNCQSGGRLLAGRVQSRLLKQDWPRTLEELEETRASRGERSPAPLRRSRRHR